MKSIKKWWLTLVLLTICLVINLYSNNSNNVEKYYSLQFYPLFSSLLRTIFGWIPFSFGDIFYGLVFCWLIFKITRIFKFLLLKNKKQLLIEKAEGVLIKNSKLFAIIYLLFNTFWGINYNRLGIAAQLNLKINTYSIEELEQLNFRLVNKINICKTALANQQQKQITNKELYKKVADAYNITSKKYSFLTYKPSSIKPSLWGWFGNYAGFTGYYNPFTGEAQVNTTVPFFTQPFTTCHEVAHQLGYAKEMEANFVGYLVAKNTSDTLLLYSTYTSLFSYANRTLYFADTAAAVQYRKQLLPAVIADYKSVQQFNAAHKSFVEPIVGFFYNKFLQSNQQPSGLLSYDEVTAFLIAYYKKFGEV